MACSHSLDSVYKTTNRTPIGKHSARGPIDGYASSYSSLWPVPAALARASPVAVVDRPAEVAECAVAGVDGQGAESTRTPADRSFRERVALCRAARELVGVNDRPLQVRQILVHL